MSRPLMVSQWLELASNMANAVRLNDEIADGVRRFEAWVAAGDRRARAEGVDEVIRRAREVLTDDPVGNREALLVKRWMAGQARLFDVSEEICRAAWRRVGEMVGVPDLGELPFEVCWFPGVAGECEGILVSRDGVVLVVERGSDGRMDCRGARLVVDGDWEPYGIEMAWYAWILSRVVAGCVAERPVVNTYGFRRAMTQAGVGGVPPELYVVRLDGRRAGHAVGRVVEARNGPSYRYEVRRHERLLMHRGRWPIGSELAEDFRKRGYEVERGDALSERARIGLEVRGIEASGRGEWVAWRFSEVREHEAGPKEAPIRRAVRVVGV